MSTLFSLKLTFLTRKRLIKRARLRVQDSEDFATDKNFLLISVITKSFAFFPRESYFIKTIENSFPVFA